MKQVLFFLTLIVGFAFGAQAAGVATPSFTNTIIIGKTIGEPSPKKAVVPKQTIFAKAKHWLKKISDTDTKTVALVAYLTLIGWIVAFIALKPYGDVGGFHLRNSVGIYLTAAATGLILSTLSFVFVLFPIIPLLLSLVGGLVYLFCIINWFIGIISAVNGTQKGALLLGNLYQKWFAGIK